MKVDTDSARHCTPKNDGLLVSPWMWIRVTRLLSRKRLLFLVNLDRKPLQVTELATKVFLQAKDSGYFESSNFALTLSSSLAVDSSFDMRSEDFFGLCLPQ